MKKRRDDFVLMIVGSRLAPLSIETKQAPKSNCDTTAGRSVTPRFSSQQSDGTTRSQGCRAGIFLASHRFPTEPFAETKLRTPGEYCMSTQPSRRRATSSDVEASHEANASSSLLRRNLGQIRAVITLRRAPGRSPPNGHDQHKTAAQRQSNSKPKESNRIEKTLPNISASGSHGVKMFSCIWLRQGIADSLAVLLRDDNS